MATPKIVILGAAAEANGWRAWACWDAEPKRKIGIHSQPSESVALAGLVKLMMWGHRMLGDRRPQIIDAREDKSTPVIVCGPG